MLQKTSKVITTSRPIYWLAHIGLFTIGALNSGNFELLDIRMLVPIFSLTIPFSLLVYATNDYYDLDTDEINPRKTDRFKFTLGTKQDQKNIPSLKKWAMLGFLTSLVFIIPFGIAATGFYLALCFFLYFYSAPPLRFKSIPIIDSITGGSFYSLFLILLGYSVFDGNLSELYNLPRAMVFFTAIGAVYQILGTITDYLPDKKSGITTSAVFFGPYPIITISVILQLITAYFMREQLFFVLLTSISTIITIALYNKKFREGVIAQVITAELSIYFVFITVLYSALFDQGLFV